MNIDSDKVVLPNGLDLSSMIGVLSNHSEMNKYMQPEIVQLTFSNVNVTANTLESEQYVDLIPSVSYPRIYNSSNLVIVTPGDPVIGVETNSRYMVIVSGHYTVKRASSTIGSNGDAIKQYSRVAKRSGNSWVDHLNTGADVNFYPTFLSAANYTIRHNFCDHLVFLTNDSIREIKLQTYISDPLATYNFDTLRASIIALPDMIG